MIKRLIFFLVLLSTVPCFANPAIYGVWKGGDRAHASIYGNIKISGKTISFSRDRKRWKCPIRFRIAEEGDKKTYTFGELPYDTGFTKNWTYVRLYLKTKPCVSDARWIVLAFMQDQPDYAAMVEFDGNGAWLGSGHFYRVSP